MEKANWISGSNVAGTNIGTSLGDLEGATFDQFKNRKTTYKDSLYNTSYDINAFTEEQKADAERLH